MRDPRRALATAIAAGAAVVALAAPAGALAKDYCVQNAACVTAGGTDEPSVNAALTAANADAAFDRVLIGPGTFTAATTLGYSAPVNPVQIVGAGAGSTTLTGPVNTDTVLSLNNAADDVSDLAIRVPQNSDINTKFGLDLRHGTAERLSVTGDPAISTVSGGVDVWNGTLSDSVVALPTTGPLSVAVDGEGNSTIINNKLTGESGIRILGAHVHTDRNSITASHEGIGVNNSGVDIEATNTLIHVLGSGFGVGASTGNGLDSGISARNVTIVGDGTKLGSVGVLAGSNTPHTATVTVDGLIIRNLGLALKRSAPIGSADLAVSYSDYDTARVLQTGPGTLTVGPGNINADPLFAGAADFHIMAGSPATDSGNPADFADAVDLDGNPRVTDGNGDGTARRDMGAYETAGVPAPPLVPPASGDPTSPAGTAGADQPTAALPAASVDRTPPAITKLAVSPKRFVVVGATAKSGGTSFRFRLSEDAAVRIVVQRRVKGRWRELGTLSRRGTAGADRIRFSGRLGRKALRPGAYRAVVSATDAAGNRSHAHRVAFVVVSTP